MDGAAGVIGVLVSAVLLCSGLSKFAAPGPSRAAISELLPALRTAAVPLVRALCVVETAAAVAVLLPATRVVAGVAIAALGASFAGAGWWARRHGSRLPCGCFGRPAGRPLGGRTVAVGAAVAAAGTTEALLGPASGTPALPALTAAAACLLTAMLHRGMLADLVRPARTRTRSAAGGSS